MGSLSTSVRDLFFLIPLSYHKEDQETSRGSGEVVWRIFIVLDLAEFLGFVSDDSTKSNSTLTKPSRDFSLWIPPFFRTSKIKRPPFLSRVSRGPCVGNDLGFEGRYPRLDHCWFTYRVDPCVLKWRMINVLRSDPLFLTSKGVRLIFIGVISLVLWDITLPLTSVNSFGLSFHRLTLVNSVPFYCIHRLPTRLDVFSKLGEVEVVCLLPSNTVSSPLVSHYYIPSILNLWMYKETHFSDDKRRSNNRSLSRC